MKIKRKSLAYLSIALTLLATIETIAQPLPYKSAHCQDFFISIKKGLLENVQGCLKQNSNLIYKTNEEGHTPLMVACEYGQTDIIKLLIKNKAKVNVGNQENIYPIHLATLSGNEQAVKLLLKNKCDLSVITNNNKSVMDFAALKGNEKLMDYFKRKNSTLFDNDNLILVTAYSGNKSLFNQLKNKGYNIHFKDNELNGALHHAAKGGNTTMCKYLVNYYKFDIRALNKSDQYPIEIAIEAGNLEVVRYFLSGGIGSNETNKNGQTWIELSKYYGWIHITNCLEKQNQIIHNMNVYGELSN